MKIFSIVGNCNPIIASRLLLANQFVFISGHLPSGARLVSPCWAMPNARQQPGVGRSCRGLIYGLKIFYMQQSNKCSGCSIVNPWILNNKCSGCSIVNLWISTCLRSKGSQCCSQSIYYSVACLILFSSTSSMYKSNIQHYL